MKAAANQQIRRAARAKRMAPALLSSPPAMQELANSVGQMFRVNTRMTPNSTRLAK